MNKLLSAALSLGLLFGITACGEEKKQSEEIIRPISWLKVPASSLQQERQLSGVIESSEIAELSFEVGGNIQNVSVKLGDEVVPGMELASIDPRDINNEYVAAQADYDRSKVYLSRIEKALLSKAVSQQEYSDAKAKYDIASSELKIRKKALSDTVLKAPYKGRITSRLIEPSQQIKKGEIAFTIEGEGGLEILIMVPETIIQKLSQGDKYSVIFPAARGISLMAELIEVGTHAEKAGSFPVTLKLLETHEKLRSGMSAEVTFTFIGEGKTADQIDVVKIPVSAILPAADQGGFVFVYNPEDQTVSKRHVQPENIIGNEVLVSAGVKPNEIIAIAGVTYLRDGQKVTLLGQSGIQQYN